MQVLKLAAHLESVMDIFAYEGFVYYTCAQSHYLYKCNHLFERIKSIRLLKEINKFAISGSRIFTMSLNDHHIYIYNMDGLLLHEVVIFDKDDRLNYFIIVKKRSRLYLHSFVKIY